jgi:hypothetical protein
MAGGITYQNAGAPIIPNVQIETVFYGSAWSGQASNAAVSAQLAAEAQDLDQFFAQITSSAYMDGLAQYTGSNGAPGRGTFVKADFVAGTPQADKSTGTVSEATVQAMLSKEIKAGHLDGPNGNILYFIFMPPGSIEAGDVPSGGGHHWSFSTPLGSGTGLYATIENPLTPGFGAKAPLGAFGNETNFQTMTEVSSHEMAEAITDPLGNVAGKGAWFGTANNTGEIGDIVAYQAPAGTAFGLEEVAYGNAYLVQNYWMGNINTPSPGVTTYQALQTVPSTLADMGFTLVDQNGTSHNVSWTNETSSSAKGKQATFAGTFDGQAVTVQITANVGQYYSVTITTASGTQLFQGRLSQPAGQWRNETGGGQWVAPAYAELSGTFTSGKKSLAAFGTGGYASPWPQFTGSQYGGSYGYSPTGNAPASANHNVKQPSKE